jgi:ribosomal-protein-alanine N-acetyltransferase
MRVGYDCWGLQAGPQLVGYSVLTRAAGECHLLNLCIHPDWQNNGYGSLLLEHAIRLANIQNCSSMFLEVRPSNPAGVRLYRRRGFAIVGERQNYYRAELGRENAIIMRKVLDVDGSSRLSSIRQLNPF